MWYKNAYICVGAFSCGPASTGENLCALCSHTLWMQATTRHIDFVLNRIAMLKHYGIIPIVVLDGAPLPVSDMYTYVWFQRTLCCSRSLGQACESERREERARHTWYSVAEFFAPPFFGPQGKANVNHSREVRSSTSRPPPSSQPFSWVSFTAMLLPIYHSLMFHKWGFSLLLTFSRCPSFARSPSCVSSLRVLQLLTSEYWIPQISTCVSLCLRPSADRWKRKVKSIWIGCAPPRTHPPFFHPLLASSPCFPLQLSLSFSLLAFLSLSLIFSLLTLSLPVPLLGCRMEHSNLCDM